MAACIHLATNAYLEALQMPVGVPNTMFVWVKSMTLGTFGELFLSETSSPAATAGDAKSGIDVDSGGTYNGFYILNVFDGALSNVVFGDADTWYCEVFSTEDSGNTRLRVFSDNAPTLTKLWDGTRAWTGNDKRYAVVNASNGAVRVAFFAVHQGGVLSDAEIRAQAVLRTSVITPSAGAFFAAMSCSDHTVMDDFIGSNDFLNGGTLSTVADEPAAFSASSAALSEDYDYRNGLYIPKSERNNGLFS